MGFSRNLTPPPSLSSCISPMLKSSHLLMEKIWCFCEQLYSGAPCWQVWTVANAAVLSVFLRGACPDSTGYNSNRRCKGQSTVLQNTLNVLLSRRNVRLRSWLQVQMQRLGGSNRSLPGNVQKLHVESSHFLSGQREQNSDIGGTYKVCVPYSSLAHWMSLCLHTKGEREEN